MSGHLLDDNCISQHVLPCEANAVDYSSELNLYATLERARSTLIVWNPTSKKTVAEFDCRWDGVGDILFLPGNYVAVSGGEAHHGSDIQIFSLSEKTAVLEIEVDDFPGCLTLTPDQNLLVAQVGGPSITEIQLDLENMKVIGNKEIWTFEEAEETGTENLCCSRDYTIYCSAFEDNSFSCVHVGFTADGKVELSNEQTVTYCMINGEERSFEDVRGLEHDGENVIVATDKDIIAVESATEGSPARVIVNSGIPVFDFEGCGQIRLTDNNQLIVCDGSKVIKVYDYKRPNCLQGLCRYNINNSLKKHGEKQECINKLPIPKPLRDYLLYKV